MIANPYRRVRPPANRNGIATPVRLPSGAWRYRIWDDFVGKYVSGSFIEDPEKDRYRRRPGCETGDAWAKLKQARMITGLDTGAAKVPLATVAEAYLTRRKDLERSESHLKAIRNTIRVVEEAGVEDLTEKGIAARVQRQLALLNASRPGQRKRRPVNARTKNHHINILRSIGDFAVRHEWLVRNPFLLLERYNEARNHRRVYSIAELRRLVGDDARWPARTKAQMEALVERHRGDVAMAAEESGLTQQCIHHRLEAKAGEEDDWWLFVVLAAYTGQRSQTVRGITWEMVDWDVNRLRLPASLLKANQSVRAPIQPELAAILRERQNGLIAEQRRKGLPLSALKATTVLPPHIAEVTSDRANHLTQKYLLRVGVPSNGRSVHCFRHSVASLLTATGMSPFLVMDAVGHSSTVTSKHYSRGSDEYRDQVRGERWPEGRFYFRETPPGAGPRPRTEDAEWDMVTEPAPPGSTS